MSLVVSICICVTLVYIILIIDASQKKNQAYLDWLRDHPDE